MARASKRSFVSRIVSKVTEIKNILAEVAALTAEKTNLQSDPVTNAQVITEKTQKIEAKTKKIEKKVKRSEEKVNVVVVQKIEQKITASLIVPSEEDYGLVSAFNFGVYNTSIKFNSSIKYNHAQTFRSELNGFSWNFKYGTAIDYFGTKFVIFKGEAAIQDLSSNLSITTDSRGYYAASLIYQNGNLISGKFRTNWIKYKRNDIWCLYDAENDIMYYNNYTGNDFVPTKKWYRSDVLYKTSIELEIGDRVGSSSASGSDSGSGGSGGSADGTGNSIGTDLVDQFLGGSGSDGSSGGNSIGTNLVDEFLSGSSSGNSIGSDLVDDALFNAFVSSVIFGPDQL
jgi:hypothetical protein